MRVFIEIVCYLCSVETMFRMLYNYLYINCLASIASILLICTVGFLPLQHLDRQF